MTQPKNPLVFDQAAENLNIEPKCPRCGDMFYHPKSMIEDQRQSAKEWEDIAKSSEKKLEAALKMIGDLKRALEHIENEAQLGRDDLFYTTSYEALEKLSLWKKEMGI